MRLFELMESKTLYHGTLRKHAPSIKQLGLIPDVGNFTKRWYDEYDDLEELIFATDKTAMNKVISAIIGNMREAGIKVTLRNFFMHGALVVFRDGEDFFDKHNDDEYHPAQVEPEDYYRRYGMKPDYILTGRKFKSFILRHAKNELKKTFRELL
jgi:hypothetical protein